MRRGMTYDVNRGLGYPRSKALRFEERLAKVGTDPPNKFWVSCQGQLQASSSVVDQGHMDGERLDKSRAGESVGCSRGSAPPFLRRMLRSNSMVCVLDLHRRMQILVGLEEAKGKKTRILKWRGGTDLVICMKEQE